MAVQYLATQFGPGFDAPLLPDQFYVKAGFYTVKTITQRNNIKPAYRKLDGFTSTIVFVADTNRLYKLINEPGTTTTSALDWEEIVLGTSAGISPVGEWDPTLNSPALTDAGASGRNGEFYFVINAGTGYNFIDANLFEGALVEVFNGDWIISVGDKWTVLRPTVTWDQITKPQSIVDYVSGSVIAHEHTIGDITGLTTALDAKYDSSDTADHTIDFSSVPDTAIIELEFLKTHYYTAGEINTVISNTIDAVLSDSFWKAAGTTNFTDNVSISPDGYRFDIGGVGNAIDGDWYFNSLTLTAYNSGTQQTYSQGGDVSEGFWHTKANNYVNGIWVGLQEDGTERGVKIFTGDYTVGFSSLAERIFFSEDGSVRLNLGSDVTGDMYQRNGNNLSRLASVATGNVLRSGGVGALNTWGKVTSSHIDSSVSNLFWKSSGVTGLTGNITVNQPLTTNTITISQGTLLSTDYGRLIFSSGGTVNMQSYDTSGNIVGDIYTSSEGASFGILGGPYINITPTTLGVMIDDTGASSGLFYNVNYSANGISNHGARWIPDKGYNDSTYWKIDGTTSVVGVTTQVNIGASGTVNIMEVNNHHGFSVGDGSMLLWGNDPVSGNVGLSFDTFGALFNDSRTSKKGLLYGAAGYVTNARSLTDKEYVDTHLGSKTLAIPTVSENGQSIRWNNTADNWEYFTPGSSGWPLTGTASLTGAVTITTAGNTLNIQSGAGFPKSLYQQFSTGFIITYAPTLTDEGAMLNVQSDQTILRYANAGATKSLIQMDADGMEISSDVLVDIINARAVFAAHSATAGTAPIKLAPGTAMSTPEDGALEYHGSHLYFTIGSTRKQLDTPVPGSDSEIIFNDGGVYGADAGLKYDKTTKLFGVTGQSILTANNSGDDSVTYVVGLVHGTTLTPQPGIGTGLSLSVNTGGSNIETGLAFEAICTDLTSTLEQFEVVIKTMTSGAVTEKFRINNAGALGVAGANYGTAGQVLTSNGPGAPPSWQTP